VVLYLQVFPETKRRQYKQLLDAYEATLSDEVQAEGDRPPGNNGAPMSTERPK
jgi:hypothetical protein